MKPFEFFCPRFSIGCLVVFTQAHAKEGKCFRFASFQLIVQSALFARGASACASWDGSFTCTVFLSES